MLLEWATGLGRREEEARTMRHSLVRHLAVILISALSMAVSAGPAAAAEPARVLVPVDVSFEVRHLTAACGIQVSASFAGTFHALVFRDNTGAVREIDTAPGMTFTIASTYGSFSFPFAQVFRTEYPDGTAPGSRAIVTVTGLASHVPGISSEAGTVVFEQARVLFVLPSGVPIVDFGPPTLVAGNPVDPNAVAAAACAVLTP